jgi:hypothetical protein
MVLKNPTLIHGKYARWVVYGLVLLGLAVLLSSRSLSVSRDNGFDLSDPLVPREAIFHGGPPRDGIPSIDNPRFVSADKASFLKTEDRVLGLVFDGVVRAYPIKILNYHEIVNDRINGQTIVISYCPLCGSGIAFKPESTDTDNTFGVSGLLYNSDMLLYDRDTESLWSQIMGIAISGKLKGKKLLTLVMADTTWAHWLQRHPDTEVLSTKTGYWRDYDRHPYGAYDINNALYFPVSNTNVRYHPKERVIGLTLGQQAKAYPFSELAKQHQARFSDEFAGQTLTIEFDAASQSAVIYDAQHRPLPTTTLFWFAWYAFHPDTDVFRAR